MSATSPLRADGTIPEPSDAESGSWLDRLRERTPPRVRRTAKNQDADAEWTDHAGRWAAEHPSRDPLERVLIGRAARLAWELERGDADEAALRERVAEEAARREADEVDRLGQRLLDGPGTTRARGTAASDPPPVVLRRLEATAGGCRWLLARWFELAALLERGLPWGHADLLRLIRLLGKHPLEAAYDAELNAFVSAWEYLRPGFGRSFFEACQEHEPTRDPRLARRHSWRALGPKPTSDEAFHQAVLGLVVRRIRGLQRRLGRLESATPHSLPPVGAPEAAALAALQRLQLARTRELRLTLGALRKGREAPREPAAPQPAVPERLAVPPRSARPPRDRRSRRRSAANARAECPPRRPEARVPLRACVPADGLDGGGFS